MSLESSDTENVIRAWKKGIKFLLDLPIATRSIYLPVLINCLPLGMSLEKRFVNMFSVMINSKNNLVQAIASTCLHRHGILSRNANYIMYKYNLVFSDLKLGNIAINKIVNTYVQSVHMETKSICDFIREICLLKRGELSCHLSCQQYIDILWHITTSVN